jgi:hypothetical protein
MFDLQISRVLWRRRRRRRWRRAHHATPRDGAMPRFFGVAYTEGDRQARLGWVGLAWVGSRSGPWRLQGLVPTCLRRRVRPTRREATRRHWRFGCGHGVSCSGDSKRSRQGRVRCHLLCKARARTRARATTTALQMHGSLCPCSCAMGLCACGRGQRGRRGYHMETGVGREASSTAEGAQRGSCGTPQSAGE